MCYSYYTVIAFLTIITDVYCSNSLSSGYITPIFMTGPETRTHVTVSDESFAVHSNPNQGWFSCGVTLKDKTNGMYFSTTNSHNVCGNPTNLTSYDGFKLISTRYNYPTSTECGKFYWFNQTEGKLSLHKSGLYSSNMIDFTGYKIYLNPPIGYEVEKYGAATGRTRGKIYSRAPFVDHLNEECNMTISYNDVYFIESLGNTDFSSPGDCSSVVVNTKDKYIIGIVTSGIAGYSLVVPFTACYDGYFGSYTNPNHEQKTELTTTIIIIVLCFCAMWAVVAQCGGCHRCCKQCKLCAVHQISNDVHQFQTIANSSVNFFVLS